MNRIDTTGQEVKHEGGSTEQGAVHGNVLMYPGVNRNTVAVGGGKGGVGKSMLATGFAVGLSKRGYKVLIIDADLGAPNVHTLLGMDAPRAPLSTFLTGAAGDIRRVIARTPVPNLELISAAKDPLDAVNIRKDGLKRLREGIEAVDHDYILLDLAPGTSSTVIELFNMAETGVVVTTPEPTAMENTYRFLKCVFLGKMKRVINRKENAALKEVVGRVFSPEWKGRVKTFGDILAAVRAEDQGHAMFLKSAIEHTGVKVLVNKTRSERDSMLGGLIRRASRDYFDLDVDSLGAVGFSTGVMDMVAERGPLPENYESTIRRLGVDGCLEKLLEGQKDRRMRAQREGMSKG